MTNEHVVCHERMHSDINMSFPITKALARLQSNHLLYFVSVDRNIEDVLGGITIFDFLKLRHSFYLLSGRLQLHLEIKVISTRMFILK